MVASLLLLLAPLIALAETKILTAEAAYTMGDGETPSFAEAMALQKAKQMALEQAGTYVESYTKVQNLDLTIEEIQTIAGGVLQVEVMEKKRSLVGDGLQIYVKIKATVTTDKMQELATRIKGKNIADEYTKLQEEYGRLGKEIESWKQLIATIPPGQERETALDQIREREKTFVSIQKSEVALFQRLVSGEALVQRAQAERSVVDSLLRKIVEQGHQVTVGAPTIHRTKDAPDTVKLRIPITLQANSAIRQVIEETAQSLGGRTLTDQFQREFFNNAGPRNEVRHTGGIVVTMAQDLEVARYFQERIGSLQFTINIELENGDVQACMDWAENRDQRSVFYLESNPLAPVSWLGNRKFSNRYGVVEDLADYWRKPNSSLVRWIGNLYVLIAGSLDPIDPRIFGTDTIPRELWGRVVIFEDVRQFTVTTVLPTIAAKRIKAIRGEFIDVSMMQAQAIAEQSGPQEAQIKNDRSQSADNRSWWQRLFQTEEPKSDEGNAATHHVSQQKSKVMSISCTIER